MVLPKRHAREKYSLAYRVFTVSEKSWDGWVRGYKFAILKPFVEALLCKFAILKPFVEALLCKFAILKPFVEVFTGGNHTAKVLLSPPPGTNFS